MARTDRSLVVGAFQDATMAQQAIEALQDAGFAHEQILHAGQATAHTGGFFAGLKSLFTGEETSHERGSILSDLAGMGIPQAEAQYYEREYEAGSTVVAVQADGREQEAITLLRNHGANGANDVATRSGPMRNETTTAETTAQPAYERSRTREETDEQRTLRLREEQLQATKERVQTGEVTLRKDVVTEQKTVNVPVTHEEVILKRRAVAGGQIDTTPIGEEETIRVPVSEEQVQVTKTPVVTGEVAIGKRAVQETQQVSDTVKREEIRVEQQGDAPIHGTRSDYLHPDQRNEETI